jgi:hypothetical protein
MLARKFAVDHSHRYNEDRGLKDLQEAVDGFAGNTNHQISQLDQTGRDLL